MLETAVLAHAGIQRILTRMTERRMAQIVRQCNRFDEVFIDMQNARDGAPDLRDLKTVREPRTKQIALMIDEYLRFVLEPAKRGAVNDPVAVALEFGARRSRGFEVLPTFRLTGMGGVGSEFRHIGSSARHAGMQGFA